MPAQVSIPLPALPADTFTNESERLKADLERVALLTATSAQMILFMDSTGALRAEMPGINGARRKVDLPIGFREANPGLVSIFQVELARIADLKAAQARAKAPAKLDLAASRDAHNAEVRAEKLRRWNLWIDSLKPAERELQIAKRDRALLRAKEADEARARAVWTTIASDHDIRLANQAIPADRRPRRKVIVINNDGSQKLVSPRTSDQETKTTSRPRRKSDGSHAIELL